MVFNFYFMLFLKKVLRRIMMKLLGDVEKRKEEKKNF